MFCMVVRTASVFCMVMNESISAPAARSPMIQKYFLKFWKSCCASSLPLCFWILYATAMRCGSTSPSCIDCVFMAFEAPSFMTSPWSCSCGL